MKSAPFEYVRPAAMIEAIEALAGDENAKLIAGGQSLVPLMALRLARPTLLIDVADIFLGRIERKRAVVSISADVTHGRLEHDPVVAEHAPPIVREAAGLIGYPAIRNRGTIGGSLAHADPVAELPAVLVAVGGAVVVRGTAGVREIAAGDLFAGFLETTLAHDEIIEEVHVPIAGPGHGSAFCEWAPREGDFAVAGIALTIERDTDGRCAALGAAACGIASVPLDCAALLDVVIGAPEATDALLRDVAVSVRTRIGGDADRADLAGLLAARAVRRAFDRSANRFAA